MADEKKLEGKMRVVIRLPKELVLRIARIADLAGVTPTQATSVLLAAGIVKAEG